VVGAYALSQIVERSGWSADYILTGKGPITRNVSPEERLRLEVAAVIAAQEGITMEFLLDPRVLPSEDELVHAAADKVRPHIIGLLRQYRDRRGRRIQEQQPSLRRKIGQLLGVREPPQLDELLALFNDTKAQQERDESWLDGVPSPDGRGPNSVRMKK
jgi:hypothetical protein